MHAAAILSAGGSGALLHQFVIQERHPGFDAARHRHLVLLHEDVFRQPVGELQVRSCGSVTARSPPPAAAPPAERRSALEIVACTDRAVSRPSKSEIRWRYARKLVRLDETHEIEHLPLAARPQRGRVVEGQVERRGRRGRRAGASRALRTRARHDRASRWPFRAAPCGRDSRPWSRPLLRPRESR